MTERRLSAVCLVLLMGLAPLARADDLVFKSKDGHSELVLPQGWNPLENPPGSVQIAVTNPALHVFAEIITEDRRDYEGDLHRYATERRDAMLRTLRDGASSEGRSVTVNGNPAWRFELNGTRGDLKIAYVFTVVQIDNDYHQVLVWCGQSRFEDNKVEMEKIAQDLRQLKSASANPGSRQQSRATPPLCGHFASLRDWRARPSSASPREPAHA